MSVGVAADVTAADPSSLYPADPAVVRSFRLVGQSLYSSSFSSFYSSSSLSYSSLSMSAFFLPVVVPEEAEPIGEG